MIFPHSNFVGKDSHGDELYAGIWFCRSFFEIIMEIPCSRNTFANSSMEFDLKSVALLLGLLK